MLTGRLIHARVSKTGSGFTLVETLLALLLGSVILGSVLLLVVRIGVAGGGLTGASHLDRQTRLVTDQINRELQRAGYLNWHRAWDDCLDSNTPDSYDDSNADGKVNILDFYECVIPAFDVMGRISLWRFPLAGDAGSGAPVACTTHCDCILYSYDFNNDGFQGVGSGVPGPYQTAGNFELYGFRWNDNAVEARVGGASHRCDSGSWRDLNDARLTVSQLGFSLDYASALGSHNHSTQYRLDGHGDWDGSLLQSCTPLDSDPDDPTPVSGDSLCLASRTIGLTLQTELATGSSVVRKLHTLVKNRNNHLRSL